MNSTKSNGAKIAASVLPFPEKMFKEYLSLMGAFNEQGKVDEETKALPYRKLTRFLTFAGKEQIFLMALGDWKDRYLSFDNLVPLADWFLHNHHGDSLSQKQPSVTWTKIIERRKKRDAFYKILECCVYLGNGQYLSTHRISKETALQSLLDYYKKNKNLDWRDRRNIREKER